MKTKVVSLKDQWNRQTFRQTKKRENIQVTKISSEKGCTTTDLTEIRKEY